MSGSDIYKWNSIPNKKIKSMDLDVKVVESSFVAPSATTPRKALWLSSLDCSFANRGHTSTIYFYPSTEGRTVNFSDVTNRLKGVLGQGLGGFLPSRWPPWRQRGWQDTDHLRQRGCALCHRSLSTYRWRVGPWTTWGRHPRSWGENLFLVLTLRQFYWPYRLVNESPKTCYKFISMLSDSSNRWTPSIPTRCKWRYSDGCFQGSILNCEGILLGAAQHHATKDAVGAFHFFQTWSAIAIDGDAAPAKLPYHDRTLSGRARGYGPGR